MLLSCCCIGKFWLLMLYICCIELDRRKFICICIAVAQICWAVAGEFANLRILIYLNWVIPGLDRDSGTCWTRVVRVVRLQALIYSSNLAYLIFEFANLNLLFVAIIRFIDCKLIYYPSCIVYPQMRNVSDRSGPARTTDGIRAAQPPVRIPPAPAPIYCWIRFELNWY